MTASFDEFPPEGLTAKHADRLIDLLSDGGAEARALKAVRTFRTDPSQDTASAALVALAALPGSVQQYLRTQTFLRGVR